MNIVNEIGKTFGALTVIASAGRSGDGQARWLCRCVCGKTHEASGGHLRRGNVTSCGCRKAINCSAANLRHGDTARGRMTPEYRAWSNMIDRCERPGNRSFADYGGRGIKVCAEWRTDYAAFLTHVGRRPSAVHTIERIDNARGYEPGNVRWALRSEQNRNKRSNINLTHGGKTLCLRAWAREVGIKYGTLHSRHRAGWTTGRLLSVGRVRQIEVKALCRVQAAAEGMEP